jgi:hypothetical protein
MGKSGDELKARQFTHGTVRSSIASVVGARSFRDCRCRLSEAMQTQSFFLMQRLDFVVVVVLSICRHFLHFCIYRWLSRAPGCKVLMKHCTSGYVWTFETSCLMNVSFFHIFVYTVLEQLGIGGSSRVVAIVG